MKNLQVRPAILLAILSVLLIVPVSFFILPDAEDEEEKHNDPGYFNQWFERHKNDQGVIPDGLYTQWYKHDLQNMGRFYKSAGHIDTVTCMGPFNQGGRTRALLASSTDSNLIFAGAMSGGLWKTTNGGNTWMQINDAAVSLAVSCITQSPFDPNEIYYGTGESRSNSSGVPGDGVFMSTDLGATFNQLPSTSSNPYLDYIWSIEHSKTESSTVYAGTNTGGLFKTTDKGNTWKNIAAMGGCVSDIATFMDGKVMYTMKGGGIYVSPTGDSGTFAPINSSAFPTAGFQRVEIAYCLKYPQIIFAAFERLNSYTNTGLAGFCKSNDGGVTWTATASPNLGNTFDTYCLLLGVSPIDSNKIICGGSSVRSSSNGAQTWNSTPTVHADHHSYSPLGVNSKFFIIGTDGGVCRKNWDSLTVPVTDLNNTYVTTQYYGGGFAPTGTMTLGGMQDNGSWRVSRDEISKVNGADGGYAHISQQDPDLAYASTQNGAIYMTNNFTGLAPNFTSITPPNTEGKDFINCYQINYADGNQLYYRTSVGVWRTVDAGSNWTRLNSSTAISGIQTIACTEEANPTVYIGGAGRLYYINQAATFTPGTVPNFNITVPNADPMGVISVHPYDPTTLFVGFTSYVSRPRAYKVINANTAPTWINISGDLPDQLAVNQIQPDPDHPESNLFAATDFGLYYSTDSGHTWLKETRIPNVVIYEMKLRKSDSKLFLFTHGRGLWYLSLHRISHSGIASVHNSKPQVTVFPNPCVNTLNMQFGDESMQGVVHQAIFTLNGDKVYEESVKPDHGKTTAHVEGLAPGVYLLRVRSGAQETAHKFIKR